MGICKMVVGTRREARKPHSIGLKAASFVDRAFCCNMRADPADMLLTAFETPNDDSIVERWTASPTRSR